MLLITWEGLNESGSARRSGVHARSDRERAALVHWEGTNALSV
jgi:hypothetical protein